MRTWFENNPGWRDIIPDHIRISDNYKLSLFADKPHAKAYKVLENGSAKAFRSIMATAEYYHVSNSTISDHRRTGIPLVIGELKIVVLGKLEKQVKIT